MMSGVFGTLLSGEQKGGKKGLATAPRGKAANGKGRKFLAYEKLTVAELQVKAKARGIKFSGLPKASLIAKLRK
jgi:hypothetical protein